MCCLRPSGGEEKPPLYAPAQGPVLSRAFLVDTQEPNVCHLRAGDRWSRSTSRAPAGRAAGGGVAAHRPAGLLDYYCIIDGIWRRDTNILALGDGLSRPAQHDRCFDVKIVDGWRASGSGRAARLLARLASGVLVLRTRASAGHARLALPPCTKERSVPALPPAHA